MLRTPMRYRGTPAPRPTPRPSGNPFDVVAMMDELKKLHELFLSGLDSVTRAHAAFAQVKKGDPGTPGRPGTPGAAGRSVSIAEVEAAVKKFLRQPKDGVAPTADEIVASLLDSKKLYKMLKRILKPAGKTADASPVQTIIAEATKQAITINDIGGLAEKIDARFSEIRNHIATAAMRGGGDTVVAGSGVTITDTVNGNKQISAASVLPLWSTPPELPNSTITVFTVTAEPKDVVADGAAYYEGAGYSYAANQITFDNPPAQYVRYR